MGKLLSVNDTSINVLDKKNNTIHISFANVGLIKTKRNGGRMIALGAITGAAVFATGSAIIYFNKDTDDDRSFQAVGGAIAGAVIGGASGAAIGGIIALLNKPKKYLVRGNLDNWKIFISDVFANYPHYKNQLVEQSMDPAF